MLWLCLACFPTSGLRVYWLKGIGGNCLRISPPNPPTKIYSLILKLTNSDLCLYVPDKLIENFKKEFIYFINENNELDYDNLNHLCIMVKNGGPQFEKMLLDNISFFDRWTILDTGSTDETIDIINRILVGKKKGQLFQ